MAYSTSELLNAIENPHPILESHLDWFFGSGYMEDRLLARKNEIDYVLQSNKFEHDNPEKKALEYCAAKAFITSSGYLTEIVNSWHFASEIMESPIERLFYFCWEFTIGQAISPFMNSWTMPSLRPQYEIETNSGTYYADFYIEKLKIPTIIECDGHDYHSSKEQIAHDNQRQRDIENEGYTVIRFSGREINKDPVKCVKETIKRIEKEAEKKGETIIWH